MRSKNRCYPITWCFLLYATWFLAVTPAGAQSGEFFQASRNGRLDRVRVMISADPALIQAKDESGYSGLHWSAIRGQWEVFALLLDSGADPNAVGGDGGTPLHWAAHHDRPDMMALLLDSGGDPTVRNQWGRTPLHTAARRGCSGVASLLLDRGADPDAVTREGWSTLHVAYRGGHPEVVEVLLAGGADPHLADAEGLAPGEVELVRPDPIPMDRRKKDEYVGRYETPNGFAFHVWRVGDRMRMLDFADDDMIPVAEDEFLCVQEPWRVVFGRDETGAVVSMDVAFQRQTVPTRKIIDTSAGFTYVGSRACLGCHTQGPGNGPAGHWIASRHSRAVHTLTTDQAKGLAASREEYRDIADPSVETRCLMCHATAAQNPQAPFADGFQRMADGVGCEACHGPGSAYMEAAVMADRSTFLASGGRIPDELTCRGCHRDEGFQFFSYLERIRHW